MLVLAQNDGGPVSPGSKASREPESISDFILAPSVAHHDLLISIKENKSFERSHPKKIVSKDGKKKSDVSPMLGIRIS